MAIPSWNAVGVLPPVDSTDLMSAERSPYAVSLSDLTLRFGTSPERRRILEGFLRYRGRLHVAGFTTGFQWLDGSFLENIERLEGRAPKDLDVVTFFRLPDGVAEDAAVARDPDAFPRTRAARALFKLNFFVQPHFVNLNSQSERIVKLSAYWYSVWSHRRDTSWKGYLQVGLGPAEDALAAGHLKSPLVTGGAP